MKKNNWLNILFNMLVISLCFQSIVYATGGGDVNLDAITAPLTDIVGVLLLVAAGVCIAKVIHIGILFVTSSAVEKSNAKMAVLPWLIGTFLCFGAAVIGPWIISIFQITDDVLSY